MSLARESRVPVRTESSDIELRKGKWTVEEENYANKIITLFNQGMLPVVAGTTLRTYLSDKLRCDPMRITKKYAGASCIGKQVFQLCDHYYDCFQENERELSRLENLFLIRINGKNGISKRGTSEIPLPHTSIYETNVEMTTITKRPYKSNRRGSGTKSSVGEKGFVMLGGSPRLVNHRHSAEQQTGFTPYDTYRSGSDESDGDGYYYEDGSRGSVGSANSGLGSGMGSGGGARTSHAQAGDEDDYGYAFDPEGDGESARQHAQQQAALHTYHKYEEHMRQQSSVGSGAGSGVGGGSGGNSNGTSGVGNSSGRGLYSSLGRRVMSAPNLTELNLSSWKDTDYRPLPVDSLKEMFSQPIGHNNNNNKHVYSAMGTDSGRYTNRGSGRGSAAVMAARARATKLALLQHQSLTHNNTHTNNNSNAHYTQYNTHNTQYTYKDDSGVNMNSDMYHSSNGIGYGGSEGGGYSGGGSGMGGVGKARMKRSHSAMALMDFERLAGDDTAAGDFFLQFLNKVSDTSNNNTPRREPSTHTYTTQTTNTTHTTHSATGVAELILEDDPFCTGTSTAKLPGIPDTLLPVAADTILPTLQHTLVPQVHTPEQVDHVYVPSTHISSAVSSVVNSVTSSSVTSSTSSSGVVNSTSGGTSGGSEVVPAYEQEVESTMDLS